MGCCGDREKGPTKQSQKWDYITLSDFKATSAWNTAAYAWLWILFISTIVIYAVDTFTAVNLLVFNKWSSQVKPYIPFEYSKWIFAGCILFSWALWGFEWFRAIRVIKRRGVAESYMDPLAVSLQCMRSQGWRRFLVFAELTKSKKGMDLVAFFAYFAFKGAVRIILAEGPRQVINTLTVIAIVKADFGDSTDSSLTGISLFWANLQLMYNSDKLQAIIIFSMMYSLAIWAISVICLASAAILYIVFLWHYIPQQDGGLSSYCRRKVDKRLEKIVEAKVKAAIEEEERKRKKAEAKEWKAAQKAEKKGNGPAPTAPGFSRQPTLPQLDDLDDKTAEDTADTYSLRRTDTAGSVATLPVYASRPDTRNDNRPPLPNYSSERPPPLRSATNGSQWTIASYESDAPLLGNAAQPGEGGPARPPPPFSRQDSNASFARQNSDASIARPPVPRSMTPGAQRPYSPAPGYGQGPDRAFSPMARTDFSQSGSTGPQFPAARPESPFGRPSTRSESPFARGPDMPGRSNTAPPPRAGTVPPRAGTAPPPRVDTAPFDRPQPKTRQGTAASMSSNASFSRPIVPQKPIQSFNRPFTPATPASGDNSYEMQSNPYISKASSTESPYVAFSNKAAIVESPSSYVAFNPNRTASPAPQPTASHRNNSATADYFASKPLPSDLPGRSLTVPAVDNRATIGYSDIVDDYGDDESIHGAAAPAAHSHSDWHQRF